MAVPVCLAGCYATSGSDKCAFLLFCQEINSETQGYTHINLYVFFSCYRIFFDSRHCLTFMAVECFDYNHSLHRLYLTLTTPSDSSMALSVHQGSGILQHDCFKAAENESCSFHTAQPVEDISLDWLSGCVDCNNSITNKTSFRRLIISIHCQWDGETKAPTPPPPNLSSHSYSFISSEALHCSGSLKIMVSQTPQFTQF